MECLSASLPESMGYVGKLDEFTIKPLQQDSFLLTGEGHRTSSRLSSSGPTMLAPCAKAHSPCNNATRIHLRHSRADRAIPSCSGTVSSSNDDRLRDSDPESNTDDDEQRLRVYKEEGKPWKRIFTKFPTRNEPAIRTRWTVIQRRKE